MTKIALFTGTRAEYGLMYWLIKYLSSDPDIEFQLWVGGSHLSADFGMTINEILQDNLEITERLDFLNSDSSPLGISHSMGKATIMAAECIARQHPDVLVLLGDRFEALSVAQAALIANVPIAHIHGGELTFGAIDDAIRHALTKMSSLHFTSTEAYRRRVIQLGEQPDTVYCTGAPGLDYLKLTPLLSFPELTKSLDIKLEQPYFLVTFHPETATGINILEQQRILLSTLLLHTNYQIIITYPNADNEGKSLIEALQKFAQQNPQRVYVFKSLGRLRYLSAVKYCSAVIGNSSSGIIEVPSLGVPTINIGNRQEGRIAADSVINASCKTGDISDAIKKATSAGFIHGLKKVKNPYGDGKSSQRIADILKKYIPQNKMKIFYDLS